MSCNGCCNCNASSDGSSTVTSSCCSIVQGGPTGVTVPIKWTYSNTTAPSGGAVIPAMNAIIDNPILIAPAANQRFWIHHFVVNVVDTQLVTLYRGTVPSDSGALGNIIAQANVGAKGGLISVMPVIPLRLLDELFVRVDLGTGAIYVQAHGELETVA